jgi:hypothetical protein
MDRWKAGIDAHEPHEVAALFTQDAIFQGLRPYSVGSQGVTDYYEAQPRGMTVSYRILETRQAAADVVLGYLDADFVFPTGPRPACISACSSSTAATDGASVTTRLPGSSSTEPDPNDRIQLLRYRYQRLSECWTHEK